MTINLLDAHDLTPISLLGETLTRAFGMGSEGDPLRRTG